MKRTSSPFKWRHYAPGRRERAEKIALTLVGLSFLVLAAYVAFDAAKSLIRREPPEASYVGIALAALSLVVISMFADNIQASENSSVRSPLN